VDRTTGNTARAASTSWCNGVHGDQKLPVAAIAVGLVTALQSSPSIGQEWVKPGAGRTQYVDDRTACVQQAHAMALAGDALDRDVVECLISRGWQRNNLDKRLPMYCEDRDVARICKAGGTGQMYARDRSECLDRMLQAVGNKYATPGWWGLGGLIASTIQAQENKTNLQKSQYQYMKVCFESKEWIVTFKGEARVLMQPTQSTELAGASTEPSASSPIPHEDMVRRNPAPGNPGIMQQATSPSKWAYSAEQVAKRVGCVAPVATMNYSSAGAEAFTVTCGKEEPLSIRCDFGNCQVLK
jgi:hypothetical protein